MRLFMNGKQIYEGKPDSLYLCVEVDGDEEYGPCQIDVRGGRLIFRGTKGAAPLTITNDPPTPDVGVVFDGGLYDRPIVDASGPLMVDDADTPEFIEAIR